MKIINDDRTIKIEIYKSDSCPFWNSKIIQNELTDKNYPARKKISKITLLRKSGLDGYSWSVQRLMCCDLKEDESDVFENIYKYSLREKKLKRISECT